MFARARAKGSVEGNVGNVMQSFGGKTVGLVVRVLW